MALRVAFYGTVLLAVLPWVFSSLLIAPIRQAADAPPAGFEEVWREVDGLRLRGWLRAGCPERPAVVVAHGLGDSIESFVGVARHLNARGHTVLLAELRGHGRSEGTQTTLGGKEREDVRSAMAQLETRGSAGSGYVLFGVSMGAVAALRAAADRSDVRAVVVEAPYDSYRETVAHHAGILYGLPRWVPLIPLSIAVAEWRAGFDADEVDAVAAARQVHAPLLALVDAADPRMPEAVVRRVFDAHPGPKRLWVVPGADHAGASLHPDYWPQVLAFLDEAGV